MRLIDIIDPKLKDLVEVTQAEWKQTKFHDRPTLASIPKTGRQVRAGNMIEQLKLKHK